jgi:hypothetical protein
MARVLIMKLAIGLAGIPSDMYDFVVSRKSSFLAPDDIFISRPFRKKGELRYTNGDANFFLHAYEKLLIDDHHNSSRDTGFALLYVQHDGWRDFVSAFFPAVFPLALRLEPFVHLDGTSKATRRQLADAMKTPVKKSRDIVARIKKEVTERDNRTPLLLPVRNFRSGVLKTKLLELQENLAESAECTRLLENWVQDIERHHPLRRTESRSRCFVDDRNIEFHPPGRARHAFARPQKGHEPLCLISGRRRFGAPYDRAFHYDCINHVGRVRDLFFGCHEGEKRYEGSPHVNIAPNDFVRA